MAMTMETAVQENQANDRTRDERRRRPSSRSPTIESANGASVSHRSSVRNICGRYTNIVGQIKVDKRTGGSEVPEFRSSEVLENSGTSEPRNFGTPEPTEFLSPYGNHHHFDEPRAGDQAGADNRAARRISGKDRTIDRVDRLAMPEVRQIHDVVDDIAE